jgi:hypothetical protein
MIVENHVLATCRLLNVQNKSVMNWNTCGSQADLTDVQVIHQADNPCERHI